MKEQPHRNEAMTSILKMLESENSFTKIVDDILKDACEYLGISAGALLRENQEQKTVDMICEYAGGDVSRRWQRSRSPERRTSVF